MLTHIQNIIKSWFNQTSWQSDLERFIISKNPQSAADVERLERAFQLKITQGKIIS